MRCTNKWQFQTLRHSVEHSHSVYNFSSSRFTPFYFLCQVLSEFILESERESFIEQVREVIEMADEKGEGMKEGFPQVFLCCALPCNQNTHISILTC